ncbi:MAG: helix-turn-helix domain-containing protein [Tannerella sp.]|jgi:hypothetical protein|nr:helix-turn-helix domain-containing protein [Tannerella sp.]
MYHTYQFKYEQLLVYGQEAFEQAYQKEQTYRVPVVDIVNPGAVTIESCGKEEILIVRKCPEPDTIVYNNISGHSIENVINRVFFDLREHIVPMNINCLSDLFAGILHDEDIPIYFVVERFDTETGDILDTSLLPDKRPLVSDEGTLLFIKISDKESLRAILEITPAIVFGRMSETLFCTVGLVFLSIVCLWFIYRHGEAGQNMDKQPENIPTQHIPDNIFTIGQYRYHPAKNVLQGFDDDIQLNKKENAILYALCVQEGNVVERNQLLEENWGSSGLIYSRSLDTYITTLRKYLKKDPSIQIVTVKGVGYKLVW